VAITIVNSGKTIDITEGAETHNYNKDNLSVNTFGDKVLLFNNYKVVREILYSDVVSPSTSSSSELKGIIDLWLDIFPLTAAYDAFGRARVSELSTLFDLKQLNASQSLFVDTQDINGGTSTYNTGESSTTLNVTANSGDRVVHQTKQRFNYRSGKSHLIMMTLYNFQAETDVIKRIGYFSSNNSTPFNTSYDGLYLESSGGVISVNTWRNGNQVEKVLDTNFNGRSIEGIDWSKNQIIYIDFEWLGTGSIRWGLVRNGEIVYFHTSRHDNTDKKVYMKSPNQPLRWEVESTGGSGSFTYVCASVNSEGSINKVGRDGGVEDNGVHLDANDTGEWYVALALRLKATHLDSVVDLLSGYLKSDTNDDFAYRVVLNPTYNSTLTWTDVDNFSVQYALGATANTVTDLGETLKAGLGIQTSLTELSLETALRVGVAIDGTRDEIALIVRPHTANLDIHRALNWRELT